MVYGVGMRARPGRPTLRSSEPVGCRHGLGQTCPIRRWRAWPKRAGGGYLEINFGDDLGLAFAQVAEELHSQYLLGFEPPKRDGKTHDIEVKLKKRG